MPSASDDSFAWSVLLNDAVFSSDGVTSTTPWAAPSLLPSAQIVPLARDPDITYYVRFTTLSGQSGAGIDGTSLYQLDDFSFADSQAITGLPKASLNSLSLHMSQPGVNPALFQYLSSGGQFAEVDVLGYNPDGTLASADSFGAAQASSLDMANGSASLTLKYGAQSLAAYATVNGATLLTSQSSWNQILNQTGFSTDGSSTVLPTAPALSLPSTEVVVAGPDETYSASFALQANTSIPSLDPSGAYAISDFSFADVPAVGAGKTTLYPLSITFDDPNLLAPALQMLTAGTPIQELDIVGDNGAGRGLTQYGFSLAQVTSLSVNDDGQYMMRLSVSAERLQALDPTSATGVPVSTGQWNQIANNASFPAAAALAAPMAAPAAAVQADSGKLTYYVRFTLPDGQSDTSPMDGQTLYQLNGFSFDDSQPIVPGTPAGPSKVLKTTFGDLSLDISQQSLLPGAFTQLAGNQAISEVDVLGYDSKGKLAQSFQFGDAAGHTIDFDNKGVANFGLEYGSEAITTYAPDNSGVPAVATTWSWNRLLNTSGFSTGDQAANVTPLPLTLTNPIIGQVDRSNDTYEIDFIPYDPTSGGPELYNLSSFDVSDFQTLNLGSGDSPGRVTFNPLNITLADASPAPAFFQQMALGRPFAQANIFEKDATGQVVSRYTFKLVALKQLSTDVSGHLVGQFAYGGEQITSIAPPKNGILGSAVGGWNRVRNVRDDTAINLDVGGEPDTADSGESSTPSGLNEPVGAVHESSTAAAPLTYYVQFTPSASDTPAAALTSQTIYQLSNFSWSAAMPVTIDSGLSTGRATFGPLDLSFSQEGLTPALFQRLVTGSALQDVDVLGYEKDGSLGVDYNFGNAEVTKLVTHSGGTTDAEINYEAGLFQNNTPVVSGGLSSVGGWNRVQNKLYTNNTNPDLPALSGAGIVNSLAVAGAALAGAPLSSENAVGPSHDGVSYYVRFSPTSSASSLDGSTLYQLDGFTADSTRPDDIGLGQSGAGTGEATFDPLELDFNQQALTPTLAAVLTAGASLGEVDVLGYNKNNVLSVEYSFGSATVQQLTAAEDEDSTADLVYGSEAVHSFDTALPTITTSTPSIVEQGQQTVVGLAQPGVAGDVLSVVQTGGQGQLSLGLVASDGSQQVIYTAPTAIATSAIDAVSYTIADTNNQTSATASTNLQLDGGPTITAQTPQAVETGQTAIIGLVAPGLAGDTLVLTQRGGSGVISLGAIVAGGAQQVVYSAPANVAASGLDAVTYTVVDQHDDAVAYGASSIQLDAGPELTSVTPQTVEKLQSTVIGLVTPGVAGDVLTLTKTDGAGVLSLGTAQAGGAQQVIYTATATIASSGLDAVSFTIADQHNEVVVHGSSNIQLDAGPALTTATPQVVEKSQTTVIGTVTPGLTGDILKLTQTGGSGVVSLGIRLANGAQQVIYTAPSAVGASRVDAVSYTIADQHSGALATGASNVQLDAGPTLAATTPQAVEKSQTTVIGVITPGLAGDTLTVAQTGGQGRVTLAPASSNGARQVIYSAPTVIAASGIDTVAYTIVDQHNVAQAKGSSSVQLDAGPTVSAATASTVEAGQSTIIGYAAPGVVGDALKVTLTVGVGTLSLGPKLSNGSQAIVYTAPATIASSGLTSVSYSVSDQHNDAVVTGASVIPVAAGHGTLDVVKSGGTLFPLSGDHAIDARSGNGLIVGGNGNDTVFAGSHDLITFGNGQDFIIGGDHIVAVLGGGADSVQTGTNASILAGNGKDSIAVGANSLVLVGDGLDSVTTGAGSRVAVGNGSDSITVGDNSVVTAGNGADNFKLGAGDTFQVGKGADVFHFFESSGADLLAGFDASHDLLDFSGLNPALKIVGALKGNTIAADSIGWLLGASGHATAYIDATASTLSLNSSALLTVQLQGNVSALSSKNIVA